MSKLAFQSQQYQKWMKEVFLSSGAEWDLMIEAPEEDPFDGRLNILARAPLPGGDSEELKYILRGRKGAEEYFERLIGTYDARRWVKVWQGPNEPPVGERTFRLCLVEFSIHWTELMHEHGLQNGVGAFSVGWPHNDVGHIIELSPMFRDADYIITHEYSAPTMMDRAGSHCLRYRWLYNTLRSVVRFELPPLFLGEVGIDGGVAPVHRAETGWKTYCKGNFESYMEQLKWLDGEIQKDNDVVAAFIFVFGGRKQWYDFDIDEANARKLAAYMAGTQSDEPLPQDETAMDAATLAEKCRWFTEEATRQLEQGDVGRALEILKGIINLDNGLFYRLERLLKKEHHD